MSGLHHDWDVRHARQTPEAQGSGTLATVGLLVALFIGLVFIPKPTAQRLTAQHVLDRAQVAIGDTGREVLILPGALDDLRVCAVRSIARRGEQPGCITAKQLRERAK